MATKKVVPITKETPVENIAEQVEETEEQKDMTAEEVGKVFDDLFAKPLKPVTIHIPGKDYTLEFDRDSVAFAEQRGFKIEEIEDYRMTRLPELFYYAFRKHHMNVSRAQTDKIMFDDLGGLSPAVIERLQMLYLATYRTLFNPTGEPKNPKVTVEY